MVSKKEGVYIPPFRLAQMQEQIKDKSSEDYQRLMWDLLRKSLNGVINRVNISNLPKVIFELFSENLLRGRGLLAKCLLKGQLAAPNFTHVYAALIAVINSKLPEVGRLIVHRIILQFQRAYKRSDKLSCVGSLKLIAHLFNQQVVHELLPLQVAALLIENATEDSIEIACEFIIECGQVLSETTPLGMNAIFERFRYILQEGCISKRVQYTIEHLMNVRKEKFKDNPGILQALDLIEDSDKISHEIELDTKLETQDEFNFFRFDNEFEKNEREWEEIKKEILGDENEGSEDENVDEMDEIEHKQVIRDMTEADTVNLRKTIYLNVMSSVDFEECANKMLKLRIRPGQEVEVANMLIECCMHERSYLRFYGLLAQRFSILNPIYKDHLEIAFGKYYSTIDRFETNKLRNLSKFFAHLFFTDSVSWGVMQVIRLSEESTTSSSRIFIKNLMQEIAENISTENMILRFKDVELQGCFDGLFLKDAPRNTRFCINFFTSIGLGELTDELREYLSSVPMQVDEEEEESSEDSDSSSGSEDSLAQKAAGKVGVEAKGKEVQSGSSSSSSGSSSRSSSSSGSRSSSRSSGSSSRSSSSSNSSSNKSSSKSHSSSSSSHSVQIQKKHSRSPYRSNATKPSKDQVHQKETSKRTPPRRHSRSRSPRYQRDYRDHRPNYSRNSNYRRS